ncbi:polysaccharide lyase family 8 super-sandwich domain-containing protein [Catelliglobosispora koreensis]|uniref:polysaccharide lyase family 8 super-sandwich domain-containing protein n=1 Tax=Catelliglobosispora koreensis TaxID=129052 RepID=UPI000686A667|nr:polysaccharide lyase family 8 super-sandwich domain-containing protein [Catelliglobosispora koreensis]
MKRRAVLSIVPAAALLALAQPLRARANTSQASATDHAVLLANMVAMFAGTPTSNARPEVAAKLLALETNARNWLSAMDSARPGELFNGVPLGTNDPNLTTSFRYLYEIALATKAPGSSLKEDATVQRRVIDGMLWLHHNYYGDQSKGYYGNWHNWEIGISTQVSKTLVLLKDLLPDGLAARYVASMDAYLRSGKNGDVDLDSRFHTGANLADITGNRILQGAVLADDARVSKAIADQLTVFATVDPHNLQHGVTDGYYTDGSFIQHSSVAYTGSYGKALLTRVVQSIKLLDGTSYAQGGSLPGVVQGWVVNGFAPLIFEGWMMEIVKGRAVSRTTTGYADVAIIIEAVVDLSGYATAPDALALKGYVKHVREVSKTPLNPTSFVSPVSIARYADILADASAPAADLNPSARHVAFNAMDKTVHRRPGYAFALARSSSRISKYEYMSGENLMPWFQGDGAFYLYLSGQDQTQAYGVDYYTAVSPYRLAGVTAPPETRLTVPESYGTLWYENPAQGFTSSSEKQNTYVYFPRGTHEFSGGVSLGAYGAAGLVQSDDAAYAAKQLGQLPDDFVVYRNAEATKSWFMLDDEIVALAAGVSNGTTTLDSRIAAPADDVTVANGPGWIRYANNTQGTAVGYLLLDGSLPTAAVTEVTRSRRVVRTSNPDTRVTKKVFTATHDGSHLAYALVPNASDAQLASYADGRLRVLENSTRVQAIEHDGLRLLGANTFTDGLHHAGRLWIHGQASVLLHGNRIAVSDPTMLRDTVVLVVRGRPMRAQQADPGVRVVPIPGGTLITVATRHAYGKSFTATLH